MPRKPIERSNENFYHITARSNNRENFYLPVSNVWQIMAEKLGVLQKEHSIQVGGFVLMNNHFHLLILTPDEDIDRIMYFFMKDVTRKIQKHSGRINKIFGGRYKGSLIENERYLMNVYKYIYRNPIAVGLSERAEEYPYSSLFSQYENEVSPFKLEKMFDGYNEISKLNWINEKFDTIESDSIKCGLKKTVFAYGKIHSSGKVIKPK